MENLEMDKYFVADSYKDAKFIGAPFKDLKGKMKIKIRTTCDRCGGLGIIASRVENGVPIPIPVDGGVCYKCKGAGYIDDVVRAYNQAEYVKYRKARDYSVKSREEKERKAREQAELDSEINKTEWLLNHSFTKEGFTICYIGADSYTRRAELKNEGFRYDSVLGWHIAETNITENIIKIAFDDVYTWNPYHKTAYYKNGAADTIKAMRRLPKNSSSEFVGEIGERRRDQSLKVISKFNYKNSFGSGVILRFEDANKNLYCWFTSTFPNVEVNDVVNIDYSIKKHEIYNEEKVTYITRCKIKNS